MKKVFFNIFLLVFVVCLVGCVDSPNVPETQEPNLEEEYKLTVIDDFEYLLKPLEDCYKAGEEIEVHLAFLSGPAVGININGEYIGEDAETKYIDGHPVIIFIMPKKDSILYTTMNGHILKDCGEGNHKWGEGSVVEEGISFSVMKFYCKLCCKSKEEIIRIIHPEVKPFYSLQEAFNNQFLTHDELEKISNYKNSTKEEDLPIIDSAIADKILYDFCLINDISYGVDTEIPGSIRFFGEYDTVYGNTCYVVMVDNLLPYGEAMGEEIVDGVIFNYNTTQRILVWVDYN